MMSNSFLYFVLINLIILISSVGLIWVTVSHYGYFSRAKKSVLGDRLRDAFLADFLSALSLLIYAYVNVFVRDGFHDTSLFYIRFALKGFQALTVAFNLYAMYRLHREIKRLDNES